MKEFRISWYAELEDGSVLEGRSLISAEGEREAVEELFSKKLHEYRLKPSMLKIQSLVEIAVATEK